MLPSGWNAKTNCAGTTRVTTKCWVGHGTLGAIIGRSIVVAARQRPSNRSVASSRRHEKQRCEAIGTALGGSERVQSSAICERPGGQRRQQPARALPQPELHGRRYPQHVGASQTCFLIQLALVDVGHSTSSARSTMGFTRSGCETEEVGRRRFASGRMTRQPNRILRLLPINALLVQSSAAPGTPTSVRISDDTLGTVGKLRAVRRQ